jgi:hypothetical protein
VIEKILFEHQLFRNERFLLQLSVGTMPHDRMLRAIELFGTVVAPAVRKAVRLTDFPPTPAAPPRA